MEDVVHGVMDVAVLAGYSFRITNSSMHIKVLTAQI